MSQPQFWWGSHGENSQMVSHCQWLQPQKAWTKERVMGGVTMNRRWLQRLCGRNEVRLIREGMVKEKLPR
jgi:hypothetical protein